MQFVIFWNIEWLKKRLGAQPLSGRETYLYLFCWLALFTFSYLASINEPDDYFPDPFFNHLVLAIPLAGLLYAWLCNGGYKGKQFFTRVISMGWVMTMRVLVFSLPVFLLAGLAPMEQSGYIQETLMAILDLVIFWRLGHHISQLSTPTPVSPEEN